MKIWPILFLLSSCSSCVVAMDPPRASTPARASTPRTSSSPRLVSTPFGSPSTLVVIENVTGYVKRLQSSPTAVTAKQFQEWAGHLVTKWMGNKFENPKRKKAMFPGQNRYPHLKPNAISLFVTINSTPQCHALLGAETKRVIASIAAAQRSEEVAQSVRSTHMHNAPAQEEEQKVKEQQADDRPGSVARSVTPHGSGRSSRMAPSRMPPVGDDSERGSTTTSSSGKFATPFGDDDDDLEHPPAGAHRVTPQKPSVPQDSSPVYSGVVSDTSDDDRERVVQVLSSTDLLKSAWQKERSLVVVGAFVLCVVLLILDYQWREESSVAMRGLCFLYNWFNPAPKEASMRDIELIPEINDRPAIDTFINQLYEQYGINK